MNTLNTRYISLHPRKLTCTVDTISSVAGVARADETPLCVGAVCFLMTVVQVITITVIELCIEHSKSCNNCAKDIMLTSDNNTSAIKAVSIQEVP